MLPPIEPPSNAAIEFHFLIFLGGKSFLYPLISHSILFIPISGIYGSLYYISVIVVPVLSLLVDLTLKSRPLSDSHISLLRLP